MGVGRAATKGNEMPTKNLVDSISFWIRSGPGGFDTDLFKVA